MFLATTAIEEFWNPEEKILFLGPWCEVYSEKTRLPGLLKNGWETLPPVLAEPEEVERAFDYCRVICKTALTFLSRELDRFLALGKDETYYHIILGNWLAAFINQVYDRYKALDKVHKSYPGIHTYILDPSYYPVPWDHDDFMNESARDYLNLVMFSQLIREMEFDFTEKVPRAFPESGGRRTFGGVEEGLKFNVFKKVNASLNKVSHGESITINSAYLGSFDNYLKLAVKSRFLFVFDDMQAYKVEVSAKPDAEFRNSVLPGLEENEFSGILSRLIPRNIPLLFLEAHREFREKVLELPIRKTAAYCTGTGLQYNNIFKFFVAEHRKDVKLVSIQHGAGYGVHRCMATEEYERSICDVFYTWGWREEDRTRPLPQPRLLPVSGRGKRLLKNQVLLILTMDPRYLHRIQFPMMTTTFVTRYLDHVIKFLKTVKAPVLIRTYSQDLGHCVRERIADAVSGAVFDDLSASSAERMAESSMVVMGNHGTAFFESMAADRPTVVFADPATFRVRSSAAPLFAALREAKIYHDSPAAAAAHVNGVFDDPGAWWSGESVREARGNFVREHALSSENWVESWTRELSRLL